VNARPTDAQEQRIWLDTQDLDTGAGDVFDTPPGLNAPRMLRLCPPQRLTFAPCGPARPQRTWHAAQGDLARAHNAGE